MALLVTFWHYSGFWTKLSPIFGFAKSSQTQNNKSINHDARLLLTSGYASFILFAICTILKTKI